MQLPAGPELDFPTLEVAIVALVARVRDPKVVPAQGRFVLNPVIRAVKYLLFFVFKKIQPPYFVTLLSCTFSQFMI